MSEPFLGQITLYPYNYAPNNWALCQGQLLPIRQYTALFALLGTNFGGDGISTFGLPNLQGAMPIGSGQGPGLPDYNIGEAAGAPNVTLLTSTIPPHSHNFPATQPDATAAAPAAGMALAQGNIPGGRGGTPVPSFAPASAGPSVGLGSAAIAPFNGGSQPHNNMQPSLSLNWCIALNGIFPPRQ